MKKIDWFNGFVFRGLMLIVYYFECFLFGRIEFFSFLCKSV